MQFSNIVGVGLKWRHHLATELTTETTPHLCFYSAERVLGVKPRCTQHDNSVVCVAKWAIFIFSVNSKEDPVLSQYFTISSPGLALQI